MKQKDWKIIYTSDEGISKRAINLLSKEAGKFLIRKNGEYSIGVLACEQEGCSVSKNAFFVGCYSESEYIQRFVEPNEIEKDGFLVKVVANPNDAEGRFVILTANTPQELFYAAVSFLDDYIPEHAPYGGCNLMPDLIFDSPLTEYSYTEAGENKTRSIFTWGHSINNYRAYIDNMARLKFNELVLWNDYIPVNISEIIDYAHSYGIKVILGYSWGWNEARKKDAQFTEESIEKVKEFAVREYREKYSVTDCDGIYFQSITERQEENIGDRLIASVVTDMVNEIADELWKITPELRLIFGLHATSVKNHLNEIARVNPRVEILWEDCGDFPYSYSSFVVSDEKFNETKEFTKKLLELRDGKGVGLVFKSVMMLDWNKFEHQSGPFVMGENAPEIAVHDKTIRANAWREYSADWMHYGEYAMKMIEFIKENKKGEVNMCLAGTFDGGIYLPFALCAQMYRKTDADYITTLKKVSRRSCITVD